MSSSLESIVKNDRIYESFARIHLLINEYQSFSLTNLKRMTQLFIKHFEHIQEKENVIHRFPIHL